MPTADVISELKKALYSRLSFQKRFQLEQTKFLEFEKSTIEKISGIEQEILSLNKELDDILDKFSSNITNQAQDAKLILREKQCRQDFDRLNEQKKSLTGELKLAEGKYHIELVRHVEAIDSYDALNVYNLEDESVLGVEGLDELIKLIDSIAPADSSGYETRSVDTEPRKKLSNGISSFLKEMLGYKKV